MKIMTEEMKEQKQRIAKKRTWLEERNVNVEISSIKKPQNVHFDYDLAGNKPSMWDTIRYMDKQLDDFKEYLDKIEKVYDGWISKVNAAHSTGPAGK